MPEPIDQPRLPKKWDPAESKRLIERLDLRIADTHQWIKDAKKAVKKARKVYRS